MIAPVQLFSPDMGQITEFGKVRSGDVFNQAVVPFFDQLDSFTQQQNQQLEKETAEDIYRQQGDDQFMQQLTSTAPPQMNMMSQEESVNYDVEPVMQSAPQTPAAQGSVMQSAPQQTPPPQAVVPQSSAPRETPQPQKGGFKLSNYGYDSDSSPDYNSNVLRIGHANNKLEDGVSAALTKSLARKYGLKTGDMFEAVTASGEVLKRRYDDTVPTTYKGRALPETVDLYEQKGNNKFGGKVMEIRPIKKKA